MSRDAIFLGVDGGGSSTIAWICDADGNILAKAQTGPSNVKAIGVAAALQALEFVIAAAVDAMAVPVEKFAVACLGLAGLDRKEDRRLLEDWGAAKGWAERLMLVNDGELVLAAGTPEGWGVAVIAGTGSISVGRSATGESARAGGWGHIFGDEGSGYGTAVAALRMVASRFDGRLQGDWRQDPLSKAVCDAVGVSDPSGLVSEIYKADFDRAKIASIVPSIVAASRNDPAIVRDLLEPAGRDLAEQARAVAEKLNLSQIQLPLAMAGGFLLCSEPVSRALCEKLQGFGYQVVASRVEEPVRGALVLARRAWSTSLLVDGAVDHPRRWLFEELVEIPQSEQVHDVSRFPARKAGDGVTLESILAAVVPKSDATYITLHSSSDDFYVSVPLAAVRAEAVVVYALEGKPLSPAKGGPFRFLIRDPAACHTSELDDCANVKFLDRIELTTGKGRDTRPSNDAEHEALHAAQVP